MNFVRSIYVFLKRKIRVYSKKRIIAKEKLQLKGTNFVIIADNCWGSAVYQWYERPYNTPFAGVGIYGPCYIKLLSNFDEYMTLDLKFVTETKYPHRKLTYPLALLGDVELHFTHYKTEKDAETKWIRRTKRMLEETNKDNYYFKICDAWALDPDLFKQFHDLPFKNKVSFIQNDKKILQLKNHIGIKERHKDDKTLVPNGVKLFKICFLYYDLTQWLSTGKIVRTHFNS